MSNKAPPKEGAALIDSDCSAKNAGYANNDNAKHLANKKQIGGSVHSININNCRSKSVVHIIQTKRLHAKQEEMQEDGHNHQQQRVYEHEEQEQSQQKCQHKMKKGHHKMKCRQ